MGFTGAFRQAELATIHCEHVQLNPDGTEIHVPKTKTKPRTIGINFSRNAEYCPVRTLQAWRKAARPRGIEEGAIFRPMSRSAEIAADGEAKPISGKVVRNAIGRAPQRCGLDRDDVAGHSLRRSHITKGALNGAKLGGLVQQAGHVNPKTTVGYVEDLKRTETNTSRDLGR